MDAWKKEHKLLEKYTRSTEVRKDIEVIARGCARGVELILWDMPKGPFDVKRNYKSTGKRNVSTMRELAEALLEACDFVEKSNPEWAKHLPSPVDQDSGLRSH
jgi:hypothetical protein